MWLHASKVKKKITNWNQTQAIEKSPATHLCPSPPLAGHQSWQRFQCFYLFLWLYISSAKPICNRLHEPHLVSRKHDIKIWTFKALSDTQEPMGKCAKGICLVSSQMSEMPQRKRDLPLFSWFSCRFTSYSDTLLFLTLFNHIFP